MIAVYGDYIKKEANKFHFKSFNMDGDFEVMIEKIVKQREKPISSSNCFDFRSKNNQVKLSEQKAC